MGTKSGGERTKPGTASMGSGHYPCKWTALWHRHLAPLHRGQLCPLPPGQQQSRHPKHPLGLAHNPICPCVCACCRRFASFSHGQPKKNGGIFVTRLNLLCAIWGEEEAKGTVQYFLFGDLIVLAKQQRINCFMGNQMAKLLTGSAS